MPRKRTETEEKKGRGRPNLRPTDPLEAKRQADELLRRFEENDPSLNMSKQAVVRKINLLGTNPKTADRWFKISMTKKDGNVIKDIDSSTPNFSNIKSPVKESIEKQQGEDRLKDQLDLQKIQEQQRAKTKPSSSSSSMSKEPPAFEFNWDDIHMDPAAEETSSNYTDEEDLVQVITQVELESKHDTSGHPYVHELLEGKVEEVPDVENLNQNIKGVNEQRSRGEVDDVFSRALQFLELDELERSLNDSDLQIEEEDEHDRMQFSNPSDREVETYEEYENILNGPSGMSITQGASLEEVKEATLPVVRGMVEGAFADFQAVAPAEIKTMTEETLSGIVRDSGIEIKLDDIKQAVENSNIRYGADELAFLSSMGVQNLPSILKPVNPFRTPKASTSSSSSLSQAIGLEDSARRRLSQYLPESLRKKVEEAGGTPSDVSRFREEKEEKEGKIGGLFGDIRRVASGYVGRGLFSDDGGDVGGDDDGDVGGDDDGDGGDMKRDLRDAIAQQINSINMKLKEVSRGGKSSYPEQRKTKSYRFPRPNENYDAVKLVQNSTTNYLNDMNMYGNDNELVIDEI